MANIKDVNVKKSVWRNIVTRFGVPDSLVSDKGLHFDSFAVILALRTNTPPWPSLRATVRLKPSIKRL